MAVDKLYYRFTLPSQLLPRQRRFFDRRTSTRMIYKNELVTPAEIRQLEQQGYFFPEDSLVECPYPTSTLEFKKARARILNAPWNDKFFVVERHVRFRDFDTSDDIFDADRYDFLNNKYDHPGRYSRKV